ncbi:MAG: 5-formyltetrahydrofolate cyclo-ligase [Pseudomonadota bacterium]
MAATTPGDKDALRRDLRARRAAHVAGLTEGARREQEIALARQVAPVMESVGRLASYMPIGHEIRPDAIEADIPGPILIPWFASRDAPMLFRENDGGGRPGPWGVVQPDAAARSGTPDCLLVPLVGATPAGDRLGQGQGHFDRTIAKLRAEGPLVTIGLAWDCQIVPVLPTDDWDEVLDFVATPTRLYEAAI